jgi:microcompartment protein CcmK/EutM
MVAHVGVVAFVYVGSGLDTLVCVATSSERQVLRKNPAGVPSSVVRHCGEGLPPRFGYMMA